MRQLSRKSRKLRHGLGAWMDAFFCIVLTDSWQVDKMRAGASISSTGDRQCRLDGQEEWVHVRGSPSLIVKGTAKERREDLAPSRTPCAMLPPLCSQLAGPAEKARSAAPAVMDPFGRLRS